MDKHGGHPLAVMELDDPEKKRKGAEGLGAHDADDKDDDGDLRGKKKAKKEAPPVPDSNLSKLPEDLQDAILALRVDALKERLRANYQLAKGGRGELIERVADGVLNGALPSCPKCQRGKLKFENGAYVCKGHYDDEKYVRCYFSATEVDRVPWKKSEAGGLV